jgi:MFS family permease
MKGTGSSSTTGLFFSAPISDRWGRKVAIMVGCVVVIISTFVSAFSPRNMGGFIAGRAIVGIGQGIALPAGPTYISEIAPAESRGKIMSFWYDAASSKFYSVSFVYFPSVRRLTFHLGR